MTLDTLKSDKKIPTKCPTNVANSGFYALDLSHKGRQPEEHGGKAMKLTQAVRKIVKDNKLDLVVKGRTNGMVTVAFTTNLNDLDALVKLLDGYNLKLQKQATCYYVWWK